MIHAYDETYLNDAQTNLAVCFDYSINVLNIPLEQFWNTFIDSRAAKLFEIGDPSILAGKSGIELAHLLFKRDIQDYGVISSLRKEYWLGYVLAYFQWEKGITFRSITSYVTISNILYMYYPYHEMDITSFSKALTGYINNSKLTSNLKVIRTKLGISQSQLAKDTNIPLRTIQQYEQKQKNINKAKAEYLVALANRLFCSVNDLLEIE